MSSPVGTPSGFLGALFEGKPEPLFLLLWTLADKRSRWFREIAAAASTVEALSNQDIYVGVGLATQDHGPTHRCASDEIAGLTAVWADLDVASEAHLNKSLPPTIDQALSLVPASVPPSIVVATGNGAHAWWLLKEPYIFDDDKDREWAASVVFRWQTMLRLNAANRGWAFDRLADLARVLRIPGTFNYKDPVRPKPVTIHQFTDHRYNLSDLEHYLDELGIPDPGTYERKARSFVSQSNRDSIVVKLNAEVPEALIKQWIDADLRFRNTWFRQRCDLKDQSQSGYDLALAHFGMDAGLGAQQIADLMIQHRRMHAQKPRTRADYFERTLAKAAASNNGGGLPSGPPSLPEPACDQPRQAPPADPPCTELVTAESPAAGQQPAADPLAAKAVLCEYISEILGVRILRIVKITGKEPTYQVVLENAKVELTTIGKLLDQNSLRMAIATVTNRLMKRLKAKAWDQLAQCMLDALTEEEGGPETQLEGATRMFLEQYLADVAFIPDIDGQPSNAVRRPMLIDRQIAVNSADLQLFINKSFLQNLSVKAVASMLSSIGAKNIRIRGAKNREQGRWLLPADQFDQADYAVQPKGKTDAK